MRIPKLWHILVFVSVVLLALAFWAGGIGGLFLAAVGLFHIAEGPAVGALVFYGLKRLVRNPGDALRLLSALVSAGVVYGIGFLISKPMLENPNSEASLILALAYRRVVTFGFAILAFVFGLGIGQKPKSDWIG